MAQITLSDEQCSTIVAVLSREYSRLQLLVSIEQVAQNARTRSRREKSDRLLPIYTLRLHAASDALHAFGVHGLAPIAAAARSDRDAVAG